MNELHWYSDAIGCRLDFRKYALALQNELDPKTCELLARQGDPSILYPEDKIVKSYASDTGYVGAIKDVIHGLELEKVFVRVP
jgi:hypothetical protein